MTATQSKSIASMLTDFTPKLVPADRVTVFTAPGERIAIKPDFDDAPEEVVELIDYELKIKEAFAAGRESGQVESSVLFEAEKVRLEREFQEQLAGAEVTFLEQTGARIASQIEDGLKAIASDLSGSLAAVIVPLVENNMRERAVAAFVTEIELLTTGQAGITANITGPLHLLDALRNRPDFETMRFTMTEANQAELSLRLDDAVVETRLGRLIDSLKDHIR
ncbi:hypothetical protein [Phyllobacterium sp. YR531]|uniref:hypothetical protein n=1 Tax=Phyllobacterium sp. YR531 TaxID=1144343 RepID=UPI00026F86BC|nr:hypothetical protein [Phyllobacterium sp. YR531]EJN06376.1 hypothetical protein PMI41_00441 [Phyllobacterium sp. YR531]